MNYKIFLIFSLLALCSLCGTNTYYFDRIFQCVLEDSSANYTQCPNWNNSIDVHQWRTLFHSCFPASTLVMTLEGPKYLEDLQIHDKILSYNKQTGKNHYSEVIAWLHRDTLGNLQFQQIQTEQNFTFSASQSHNIGFKNKGKMDFKFAQSLQPGQYLVSLGKNLTVASTDKLLQQVGLYSPMTENGNFYIFAQGVNPTDIANSPMILVHCLPQVNYPLSHENWVTRVLHFADYFGFNQHKNLYDQNYVHPITYLLSIFGESQKTHKYSNYYRPDEHNQGRILRSYRNLVDSKNDRVGSQRSIVGQQHQQQQNDDRARHAATIAVYMMLQIVMKSD